MFFLMHQFPVLEYSTMVRNACGSCFSSVTLSFHKNKRSTFLWHLSSAIHSHIHTNRLHHDDGQPTMILAPPITCPTPLLPLSSEGRRYHHMSHVLLFGYSGTRVQLYSVPWSHRKVHALSQKVPNVPSQSTYLYIWLDNQKTLQIDVFFCYYYSTIGVGSTEGSARGPPILIDMIVVDLNRSQELEEGYLLIDLLLPPSPVGARCSPLFWKGHNPPLSKTLLVCLPVVYYSFLLHLL